MLVLAEISDKMPTVLGTTVAGCIVALIALGLGLRRRWLVLLPAPLFIANDLAQFDELQEPWFGQCILNELGWSYVIGCFAGWNLPFLLAIGIVALRPLDFTAGSLHAVRLLAAWPARAALPGMRNGVRPGGTMKQTRRRICRAVACTAAACAALLLLTCFTPVSLDWASERLTFIDGGAAMVYHSIGCEWEDLASWPHVQVRYEPPWSRGFYWGRWYWLPYKGGVPFSSTQRVAYFPLYMLLPPLLGGVWLLRDRRNKAMLCRCGYDLTGNVSGRCPECAAGVPAGEDGATDGTE